MPSRIDIDTDSHTWIALREWAQQKLADYRQRNDAQLTVEETCFLRGQIAMVKELLALEIAQEQHEYDGHDRRPHIGSSLT